jgi:CHAD domain-containing protein
VRKAVIEERLKRRRDMLDEITPSRLDKLTRRLVRVAAPATRTEVTRNARVEAAARSAHRAHKLRAAIEHAGGIYLADRLHRVRVQAKKLRYAVEIQRELMRSRSTAGLNRLRTEQDLLGRMHDLEILIDHARNVQSTLNPRDRRGMSELNTLIRVLEDECREGHAAYMRGRPALLKLCDGIIAADHSKPTAA